MLNHIQQLTAASREFSQELMTSARSRSKPASIALARQLAYSLPLPTSPVKDLDIFYRDNCAQLANARVNVINETAMRINLTEVLDLTNIFYAVRYGVANGSNGPVSISRENAVLDFFGIASKVPADVLKAIGEDHIGMARLIRGFRTLMEEILALEGGDQNVSV